MTSWVCFLIFIAIESTINTNTIPSEGTIQYNINQGFNSLNAFIKEYPTNILKNISLTQYHYFSTQFYFNQLTNNLQWGNRVSGLIDSNIAIFRDDYGNIIGVIAFVDDITCASASTVLQDCKET